MAATGKPAGRGSGDAFAGTFTLVRFILRLDRVKLPAWTGGIALFMAYVCVAIPAAYASEEDLAGSLALFAGPVGRMLTGPGYGFDAPTYARFVANGYGLYLLLLTALMSIFLVVRHTRAEEQSGRAELIRANVVGRHAALTATLLVALIANLAVGFAVFLVMVGIGGYGVEGSLLLAASAGATGVAFGGITAVTVQLTGFAGAATGMASAVLGAAFVIRAGGDMAREGGSVVSWLSPLAWGQQSAPFVLDRWWPLGLLVVLTLATTGVGYVLSTRRDLGGSLLAVQPGPARARPSLGTPLGLALHLQRGSLMGWGIGLAVAGLVFGAFADPLLEAADDLPEIFFELFSPDDMLASYLAYMATFMAYLFAAVALLGVQSMLGDEARGRSDPVLAMPLRRERWLVANVAVIGFAVVIMAAVVGVATGLGAAVVTGDASHVFELTLAHLNQAPSVWLVLGIAVLCFGVAPRAIGAAWVVIGYSLIVGNFGAFLDLPQVAFELSPFEHPASVPLDAFEGTPVLVLTVLAVALVMAGVIGYGRRDINVR